jgi:sn-glycerol 3-phosphate transport system ATP-binding protein
MATVALKDVRKSYARTEVIHGVSIDIADGEFIVIVGPSGCGKSTLLRMVAGLEAITSGTIEIGGRVVNDFEPRARDIAMVFQNYALYPHMTVFDNMAYGLRIAGIRGAELRARVEKAADMLELRPYLDRKPRALSGGQRQRVAMGRALVRGPAAFLLDEPLSNLDAKLRVQMRLQIKDLQRSVETTTLYVTHDQVEAMTLADRLIVMNAGRAEQIDTPMALYEKPATVFVAGFIGSPQMNLMPATVAEAGAGLLLGGTVPLPLDGPLPPAGTEVVAGLRPEHLVPDPDGLPLEVQAVEVLGADAFAHGHLPGMPDPFVVRLPGNAPPRPGTRLSVSPESSAFVHLFDPESGRRLELRSGATPRLPARGGFL